MHKTLCGLSVLSCAAGALGQAHSANTLVPPAHSASNAIVAPAGNDCGIAKSPDQGAFWQPLGPGGSYVYANSFKPCEDVEVDELGMWLLDQGGAGGPGVRFEVWESIGGNAANGPDAGSIVLSTGSLDLAGTPSLQLFGAPTQGVATLNGGTTYWFVATSVGEGGIGSWQVGGHTQNSEGIFDNGTFWFSNDPTGVNFDGQGLTPEMAFYVNNPPEPPPPPKGDVFYIDSGVRPWGMPDYENAMNAVFGAGNWTLATYADDADAILDQASVLYLEGSDSSASELNTWLAANGAALEAWVGGGGDLYMNAAPNEGGNINFGFGVTCNYPNFSAEGHAVDAGHPIFNGPFTPVATDYTGNSFGHSILTGSFTSLITNEFDSTVLAEVGSGGGGTVVLGGMTAPFWQTPQPDSQNLLQNILAYVSGGGDDCPADCNGDNALNILDFVCFQGEWQAQTPAGDCDNNNLYNILDFVCYQGVFQAGCN